MNTYIGEHTSFVQIGYLVTQLAFISAVFAGLSYYLSTKTLHTKRMARYFLYLHVLATSTISLMLLWAFVHHYFEIDYIWKHASTQMPLRYIFSAFWGGQQGSLLLWAFLGAWVSLVLAKTEKTQESYVLFFLLLVQSFLLSMLLGVYCFDYKIGTNPFALIRELEENVPLPWSQLTDYLQKVPAFQDGQGLNPLLQNYWMTIHPPVIFLGFALSAVPFAYSLSALWQKELFLWAKPALPWSFVAVLVLGIGILLGGAWAYESLSFGGFWAWDPVENAILIPWLILLGAAHLLLVVKNRKKSVFATIFLFALSFLGMIYATFLTRSGILGESSVHSFTGEGLLTQLFWFLISFAGLSLYFLVFDKSLKKEICLASVCIFLLQIFLPDQLWNTPKETITVGISLGLALIYLFRAQKYYPQTEEDALHSKEFWIFLSALMLTASSFLICFVTSIPVWNKILGTKYDAYTEIGKRHDFYNPWTALFFIFVLVAMAIGQILKYKATNLKTIQNKVLGIFLLAAMSVTALCYYFDFTLSEIIYILLLFSAILAVYANVEYIKRAPQTLGSSLAHIGFAVLIIGVIISMAKQKSISQNKQGIELSTLDKDFKNDKNILLSKKDTLEMGDYFVSYQKKTASLDKINVYYHIVYFSKEAQTYKKQDIVRYQNAMYQAKHDIIATQNPDKDSLNWQKMPLDSTAFYAFAPFRMQKPKDSLFALSPFVQLNPKFGNVAEPSSAHFLDKDIFTYIKYADFSSQENESLLEQNKMAWRKITYYPSHKVDIRQKDTVHWKDFIISSGEMQSLDSIDRKTMRLKATDVGAFLPLVFIYKHDERLQYFAKPLVLIYNEKQVNFLPDTLQNLGLSIKMNPSKFNENIISLDVKDIKPVVYGSYQFAFSEAKLVENPLEKEKIGFSKTDWVYLLPMQVSSNQDALHKNFKDTLKYVLSEGEIVPQYVNIPELDLRMTLQGFNEQNGIHILLQEKEYLVMEAVEFPYIFLVWLGALILSVGTIIAMFKKLQKNAKN